MVRSFALRLLMILSAALLSGCVAPLPNASAMLHSIALTTGPTPLVQSPQFKPIPPVQRAALVKLLISPDGVTPDLMRQLALMQAGGGAPLVAGNRVTLLNNGPASYAAMVKAIMQARRTINLETFIFADDSVGRAMARILADRSRRGVKVNVIYDSIGSFDTPAAFFDWMRRQGIAVRAFNPPMFFSHLPGRYLEHRDHRKLLIVDDEVAITGGVNISSVYTHGLSRTALHEPDTGDDIFWRDTDIRIQGPAVEQCQRLFVDTWERLSKETLSPDLYFTRPRARGDDLVEVIGSTPAVTPDPIYIDLLSAIRDARRNIWITDAYFVPDRQFRRYLRAAARRGVDVELVLPQRTDHPIVVYASRSHYTGFLKAGVKIYERTHALLHAKTITVDGIWSSVGSANLDWWSFKRDNEIDVVVLSHRFAQQMESSFEADREQSDQIELATWRRRSLLERGHEFLGWLVERWL